jgi:hypothetical protein
MTARQRIDTAALAALLARPQGTTMAEAIAHCPGPTERAWGNHLHCMTNTRHTAWAAKVPGTLALRWFGSEAARDIWQADHMPAPRPAKKLTLRAQLLAVVAQRGGRGTLPSDLAAAIGRPLRQIWTWVSDTEKLGRLCSVVYRGVRITHPAGTPLEPAALEACHRRIDRELALRCMRSTAPLHLPKERPGLPPPVTLAPADTGWPSRETSNPGQVAPSTGCAAWYDRRTQIDPLTRFDGGFRTLGVGRYDAPPSPAVQAFLSSKQAAA